MYDDTEEVMTVERKPSGTFDPDNPFRDVVVQGLKEAWRKYSFQYAQGWDEEDWEVVADCFIAALMGKRS